MTQPKIALQLYTVRDVAEKDPVGTLKAVAAVGYPAVQMAGTYGMSADDLRTVLDSLGLAVAGTHVALEALEENLDREIAYYRTLGTSDIVVPFVKQERRQDAAGYREIAASLNRLGARCREAGARLSYHNHAFEFDRFGDVTGLDILLGETDPEVVKWEPDVYWIQYGGADPAALIRQYSGRCPIVHLKDMTADESRTFAEVGEGVLDWPSIFKASEVNGAEWYVVEQDRWSRPSVDAAALSLKHLKDWGKL